MLITLKIIVLCCLLTIFLQDFKERKVFIWLLIFSGVFLSLLYLQSTSVKLYLFNIGINLFIIAIIMGILYSYTKLKLKTSLTNTLGLGDILFFIIIALSFPLATFIVLFSFSLVFSLVLFLLLKSKLKSKYVPLAGLQALFFLFTLSLNWVFNVTNLYVF